MEESTPVNSLSYYERSAEPLLWTTQLMCILAIAHCTLLFLPFFVEVTFSLWPWITSFRFTQEAWPFLFQVPALVCAILVLIAAISSLKRRGGRKTIVIGAIGLAIFSLIGSVATTVYVYARVVRTGRISLIQIGYMLVYDLRPCLIPLLLWYYFRSPRVVELYESARD